jgi:hypothetical protein
VSAHAGRRASLGAWLAVAASVVVVATVVCALIAMGPPSQQRSKALDARRIEELTAISRAIDLYVDQNSRMPASLAELGGVGQWLSIADPDDGSAYTYATTGNRTYRLCARFASATPAADVRESPDLPAWPHRAGHHCFDRKVHVE